MNLAEGGNTICAVAVTSTPRPPMSNRPTAEALRRAFADAFPVIPLLSDEQRERLRDTVCAFAEELKSEGMSAERVVIEIRVIANDVRFSVLDDHIVEEAVRWCITQYYGTQART